MLLRPGDVDATCQKLIGKIKQIIPDGCSRARIRATTRASRKLQDGTLADTMGDEAQGMVVVDADGHPTKYDQMESMSNVVAKEPLFYMTPLPVPAGSRNYRCAHTGGL